MFKVDDKDTITALLAFSTVFIVKFENISHQSTKCHFRVLEIIKASRKLETGKTEAIFER